MLPSKAREHRMRVLENQSKRVAEGGTLGQPQVDGQLRIPLLVEVKRSASVKPRARRQRRKTVSEQPGFGDL